MTTAKRALELRARFADMPNRATTGASSTLPRARPYSIALGEVRSHGACIHHRRSFSPVAAALARVAAPPDEAVTLVTTATTTVSVSVTATVPGVPLPSAWISS